MGTCQYCAKEANTVSDAIGYCADCIRTHFEEIRPEIKQVHRHSRKAYGLPEEPPASSEGISCGLCIQKCRIPKGGTGYCGLRRVENVRIKGGGRTKEICLFITIRFPPIVWVILSAPGVPGAGILVMPIQKDRSMVTKTWPCFTMPVPSIVCNARITIIRKRFFRPSR